MMPSNRIIAVALICSFLVIALVFVYVSSFANNKIEISVGSFIRENVNADGSVTYFFDYSIGIQDITHRTTLYDCVLEIKYLTNYGEWITITQDLGTQNFSSFVEIESIALPDFQLDRNGGHSGTLWQTDHQNVIVDSYGFEKSLT
ncbi:MAG: hypothetical protein GX638_03615 [Crenarchaeota archaeon]|nr:hypothetical protein [Thermoproteota archaeon]